MELSSEQLIVEAIEINHNPAALEESPKVVLKRGYTPSRDDIKRLLDAPGSPKARLLSH